MAPISPGDAPSWLSQPQGWASDSKVGKSPWSWCGSCSLGQVSLGRLKVKGYSKIDELLHPLSWFRSLAPDLPYPQTGPAFVRDATSSFPPWDAGTGIRASEPKKPETTHHRDPALPATPGLRNASGIDSPWKKAGKNRKLKSKRVKPRDSSESTGSGGLVPARPPLTGLNTTAWSPSDTSQSSCPAMPFPTPVPAYSLPVFPAPGTVAAPPMPPHASFPVSAVPVELQHQLAVQPPPFPAPLAPVMAFMLPSYSFPLGTPNLPQAFFPSQPHFPSHPTLTSEMAPASQPEFPSRTSIPRQPCTCPATRASPPSAVGRASPPLFQSRCSSPLQLNLLQLEEAPEGGTGAVGTTGATETAAVGLDCKPGTSQDQQPKAPLTSLAHVASVQEEERDTALKPV
ncbi:Period circadian protein 2 [Saguinus oedipus]|uniref:Period circadian protein 2 n=1 Tax=Saguinus oedipus TaxID=9490 RepID=A0ABQ9VGF4_SAGOE|nr:Period circadian protein 2 [Saguinus oedipus]